MVDSKAGKHSSLAAFASDTAHGLAAGQDESQLAGHHQLKQQQQKEGRERRWRERERKRKRESKVTKGKQKGLGQITVAESD